MSCVVLDTNVVIAALAARGLCASVYVLCLEQHELFTSAFLAAELEEKLRMKLKFEGAHVRDVMAHYNDHFQTVVPQKLATGICRDPDDVTVIGTATSAGAEYLVTGDQDLLVLGQYESVRMVSPREFYQLS